MRSTIIMDPTVGTFAGFIVEPIDVLTTDIHIRMEDIPLTPMEDILLYSPYSYGGYYRPSYFGRWY